MGLIKTIVTPLAILSMKMSFPSDNEAEVPDTDDAANAAIEKENQYNAISEKKAKQDSWFTENPTESPEENPYLVTAEELKIWNEYNLEKLAEFELNSGLDTFKDVEDEVSKKFGDKFGELYEVAIVNFLKGCIVSPLGGPGSISKTMSIKSDLQKCGEAAYKETFLGEDDPEDSAKKFGKNFADGCADIHEQQILMWSVIPASPPVLLSTPGGPIIATPTAAIIPVMITALKSALESTYPDGSSDDYNIASKFASKLGMAGIVMGTYALTCQCPPGGGNIITS